MGHTQGKKKVKGWSTEEMKDKVNSRVEIDTEEKLKWKALTQKEINQCWKKLVEKWRLKFWTDARSRTAKEMLSKAEVSRWRRGTQKQETQSKNMERRLLGKNLCLVQSKQEELEEVEEMKQQQRMKIMKDLTKRIRSKGRRDAESRWWVTELLAADCEKAWIHPGWEDTMQKWYEWFERKKKMMRRKTGGDASAKNGAFD